MNNLFPQLPPDARVWVYQANRQLTADEASAIDIKANAFVQSWSSHSRKVDSFVTILYNRFIIIAANQEQFQVSGCGIDSSVKLIKEIGAAYNIDFFDRFNIAYKEGDMVVSASNRTAFEKLIAEGNVNDNTIVFNNLVTTLAELNDNWEIPMKNSWHAKVFA